MDATVIVSLSGDDVQARCTLRAFAGDHAGAGGAGELSFEPDPAAGPRYEVQVRTERRATALDPIGCTTADQPRPR